MLSRFRRLYPPLQVGCRDSELLYATDGVMDVIQIDSSGSVYVGCVLELVFSDPRRRRDARLSDMDNWRSPNIGDVGVAKVE